MSVLFFHGKSWHISIKNAPQLLIVSNNDNSMLNVPHNVIKFIIRNIPCYLLIFMPKI